VAVRQKVGFAILNTDRGYFYWGVLGAANRVIYLTEETAD
jgi:hypothetical protein